MVRRIKALPFSGPVCGISATRALLIARSRPGKAGTQKAAPEGNGSSYSASGAFIFYK